MPLNSFTRSFTQIRSGIRHSTKETPKHYTFFERLGRQMYIRKKLKLLIYLELGDITILTWNNFEQ